MKKLHFVLAPLILCAAVAEGGTSFEEALIAEGLAYPYGIGAADLNDDGRTDLTLADARKPNAVYWYENEGGGKFTRHQIHHEPLPAWRIERHAIADVNRDGRPDVVVVENSSGLLIWLENPGGGRIRSAWPSHYATLAARVPGAYDVDVGDIDGDGWPDFAASSWRMGNMFSWHRSPGQALKSGGDYVKDAATDNNWAEWKQYNIAESLLETRMVKLADIDGDGDLDIVGTASRSGLVLWLENPGREAVTSEPHGFAPGYGTRLLWAQHFIDKTARPMHGQAVDMDGDGDADVLVASGMGAEIVPSEVFPIETGIAWYENLGKGATWRKHVIHRPFPEGFEAIAGDLDGDGDLDIAATGWIEKTGTSLAWYENLGGDSWTEHVLKRDWPHAVQVLITDLDGDGKRDIVASAEDGAYELRWWRNTGATGAAR